MSYFCIWVFQAETVPASPHPPNWGLSAKFDDENVTKIRLLRVNNKPAFPLLVNEL